MGPISDTGGVEQGGVSSSDKYKLYKNEQATVAELSRLGVPIRDIIISDISLADDAVLLFNNIIDIHHLQNEDMNLLSIPCSFLHLGICLT